MSFIQTIVYSVTLLAIAAVFLFFRKIYKDLIKKIIFFKKVLEEECKKDRKFDKLYQKDKQRELIKRQRILCDSRKDIQTYKEDSEIVDIAKPIGKWTQMVMCGGRLMMQRFAQLMKREGGRKGFWELFIKVQASTQGKYKGKGR
ncbi:hypothetical protein GOY07_02380 [Wolbachia endosymbiont of Litomosoides sigmodontis]|uniref:hypothetical protein n=1 Tax=Wolbachia endosymbiont of Litomosoides sigmodontis TaxID=80850 RepID=UPI00158A2FBA|nr:hypothetical protein [Wolbachia endosymbiont of Litomosoides sigmodontis]QKX03039.1 hypothetical protein GOY07_02380 [Wolbachia endosymbiont of Litomosoides sigmodontis]